MLKDKYNLAILIDKYFDGHGGDDKFVRQVSENLKNLHNLPPEITLNILYGHKSLADYNDVICYWITKEVQPQLVEEYFSSREIKNYDKEQYVDQEPVLPLKLNVLPLSDDQWLTVMSVQDLMRLRKDSLLHYNADTQRALRVMVKGGDVIYEPYVNQKAVKQMTQLLVDGQFIPNVITWNISEDDELADFNYKNGVLEITNLSAFDMVDGYNRFKAFEAVYDKDSSFNFNTGVMITNFSVDKAKRFIHQEDQKTKMRRVDSQGFNQSDDYNILLERINSDLKCNLHNEINSGSGKIRFGVAAHSLKTGNRNVKLTKKDIIQKNAEYVNKLNSITECKIDLLDRKWEDYEIVVVFFCLQEHDVDTIIRILDTFSGDVNAQRILTNTVRQLGTYNKVSAVLTKYAGGEA